MMASLYINIVSQTRQGLLNCSKAISCGLHRASGDATVTEPVKPVSWVVVREPPGVWPCWPYSHLPVAKRPRRRVKDGHGRPILKIRYSKPHKSCWYNVGLPGSGNFILSLSMFDTAFV